MHHYSYQHKIQNIPSNIDARIHRNNFRCSLLVRSLPRVQE